MHLLLSPWPEKPYRAHSRYSLLLWSLWCPPVLEWLLLAVSHRKLISINPSLPWLVAQSLLHNCLLHNLRNASNFESAPLIRGLSYASNFESAPLTLWPFLAIPVSLETLIHFFYSSRCYDYLQNASKAHWKGRITSWFRHLCSLDQCTWRAKTGELYSRFQLGYSPTKPPNVY